MANAAAAAAAIVAGLASPSPLTAASLGLPPASTMGTGQFAGGVPAAGAPPAGYDEMHFEIPNEMVGVVIGRGGENIQKIQREYGVNIQIAKSNEMPYGAAMRPVTLKGPKQSLLPAKLDVDKLIAERQAGFTPTPTGPTPGASMYGPPGGAPGMGMAGGANAGGGGAYGPRESMTMAVPNDKVWRAWFCDASTSCSTTVDISVIERQQHSYWPAIGRAVRTMHCAAVYDTAWHRIATCCTLSCICI